MKQAEVKQVPTHQIPLSDLFLATEAPRGHNLVVRDSGGGSPLSDAELKASIYHKGLIRPLIFKVVDARFYVISGNRRLRFLREIHSVLGENALVAAQNAADFSIDWRELANDENMGLPAHLVERYEQIVMLTKDLKLSEEDARLRFGMTPVQFRQVMALGKMAPVVRAAWRDGVIDAKSAQAFTLESSAKEQEKIFERLNKSRQVNEWQIKSAIIPNGQQTAGRLVAFVGIDACRKAKILKQESLFGNDHIVTDMKALNKMATEKLEAACKHLREACGWSWATIKAQVQDSYNYNSLPPAKTSKATEIEAAELERMNIILRSDGGFDQEVEDCHDSLQEEIKQRGYSDEQKAKTGCFVEIAHNGSLNIEYGRMKPAERRKIEASERPKSSTKAKVAKTEDGRAVLSSTLTHKLSETLEKAISTAMETSHHVAVAALIAAFASSGELLDVKIGGDEPRYNRKNPEADFLNVFKGALSASAEAKIAMLCKVAAQALSVQTHNPTGKTPIAGPTLQALVKELPSKHVNHAIAAVFSAEEYFAGVSIGIITEATRAAMGDDHAAKVEKMKKKDAVAFAVEFVYGAKGWLPPELRTCHYEGPTEKAAKPKATPKKKVVAKKKAKREPSMLSKKQQKAVRAGGIKAGKAAMAAAKAKK